MNRIFSAFVAAFLVVAFLSSPLEANAQQQTGQAEAAVRLAEPGNSIFAAVQEVIRKVEADTAVAWSDIDLERLRQHLVDMHRVATEVEVAFQLSIDNGVRIRVEPANDRAQASLSRVLRRHSSQLERETDWTMSVESVEPGYEIRVTTANPADVPKIRALGYIGLLTYGVHHQRIHWRIAAGQ